MLSKSVLSNKNIKMTNPKVVSPTHLPDSECRMGPSVGGVGASLGSLTVNIESFMCNKSLQKGFYLNITH